MLENIKIVLVNTSHPGNIGGAARAMKNMGLSQLALVSPAEFPSVQATARASGADNLLASATVYDTLDAAVGDCELVLATSARVRSVPWPLCCPREAATMAFEQPAGARVAVVFGNEQSGLSNAELAMAHYHVHIPTVDDFSSLNLAAAVQVLSYEMRQASLSVTEAAKVAPEEVIAPQREVLGLLAHLEDTMKAVHFLNPAHPKLLMHRVRRLFTRARLESTEVNILRGFLSAIQKKLG